MEEKINGKTHYSFINFGEVSKKDPSSLCVPTVTALLRAAMNYEKEMKVPVNESLLNLAFEVMGLR